MSYEDSIRVEATPERVWEILADVERWPTWTASMQEVRRLDREPFGVGSRVHVKQPRLPATDWVVTECEPGRSFTWRSHSAGVTTLAEHLILVDEGVVTVRLVLSQSGLLAPLIGLVAGSLTRRYLRMEAVGLKERSERDS